MAIERTFSIIKPDATRRNLTGKIAAKFEEAGLRIVASKRIHLSPAQAGKFYEVSKYVLSNPFGEGLDKEAISTRAWRRLSDQQQRIVLQTFEELEATDYFQAGIDAISTDLATWKKFNGDDSVVTVDQAALVRQMEPLNRRLADEVYGAGAWDRIRAL